ncbi:chaplin [Streptomyces sp. NPDC026665]|uniref:chaplin n=1 Tax=Streptomyces sp. NPDC026665 TaxID=3154798 RepID=UPI0033EB18DD
MRQNLSRGVVLAAAATGIMSLYASPAFADSTTTATASDSPGVGSGNNVQVPVNVPLNICGNTVDVVAALNPAFGNSCANGPVSPGRHAAPHVPAQHGAGSAHHPGRGATDHARGQGVQPGHPVGHPVGHPAGHPAGHPGMGGHGGQHDGRHAGGYGQEHRGQGGYGDEHRGQGGYGGEHRGQGGYGDERGGYGDSGHGDSRQGHSGYGDSGYGDSRQGHSGHASPGHRDSAAHHGGWSGASAHGTAHGSPGVLSGDQAAATVDVPVELCGNTLDVVGLLNPVFGNSCAHHHAPHGHPTTPHHCTPPAPPRHTPPRTVPQPPKHHTPHTPVVHTPPVKVHEQPPAPPAVPHTPPTLAETGSEGMLANGAISAALLVGGALLYRRSRAMSRP